MYVQYFQMVLNVVCKTVCNYVPRPIIPVRSLCILQTATASVAYIGF